MNNSFYSSSFTIVPIKETNYRLTTSSKTFFIGSCFSDNLYNRYSNLNLLTNNSPFGSIYNPLSIANSLERLIECNLIKKNDCFKVDGLYQHFDFHSKVGSFNIDGFLTSCNDKIEFSHNFLLKSDLLIITLGTAFVFEKDGIVVNNCHKLEKKTFNRRALNIDEITMKLHLVLSKLIKINPGIKIVLTLSPIRHLRDDPTENSLSKSILRVAISEVSRKIPLYYFPSYEILLDELRDYRWYDKTLNHPSNEAVEYIVNKFIDATSSDELKSYIKRADKLRNMMNHIIINPDSESTRSFLKHRDLNLKQLQMDYKHLIIK